MAQLQRCDETGDVWICNRGLLQLQGTRHNDLDKHPQSLDQTIFESSDGHIRAIHKAYYGTYATLR